jgi:hypothetical protein
MTGSTYLRASIISNNIHPHTGLGKHMNALDAAKSGSFKIGNEFDVNRLGFGAMRITGDGIWGEPKDRTEAIRTLRRLPEIGVNFEAKPGDVAYSRHFKGETFGRERCGGRYRLIGRGIRVVG